MAFVRKLAKNQKGATAIEYGLIVALISIVALAGISTIGTNLNTSFQSVVTATN